MLLILFKPVNENNGNFNVEGEKLLLVSSNITCQGHCKEE
jgi:hypothetical protein